MFPTDTTVQPYSLTPGCPMCPDGSISLSFMAQTNVQNPTNQNVLIVTCNTCQYAYFMATKT